MLRVGDPTASVVRWGRVVEVHGADGGPPYLVRFGNGRTALVVPGPDVLVQTREMARRSAEDLQRHRAEVDDEREPRPRWT